MTPVSVCVAVTVTPGRTPPLSSRTVPLSCAVACAHAAALVRQRMRAAPMEFLMKRVMQSSRMLESRGDATLFFGLLERTYFDASVLQDFRRPVRQRSLERAVPLVRDAPPYLFRYLEHREVRSHPVSVSPPLPLVVGHPLPVGRDLVHHLCESRQVTINHCAKHHAEAAGLERAH